MASQTSIEYGASRLRLLEFDGSGKKIRVLGVHDVSLEVDTTEGEEEADELRATLIADAVDESGVPTDPSAMSFDSAHAIFREFDLPFTNEEQIRKVVRFEAEGHMPLDIEEVVLQHIVLRQTRDKSHVLVAAIKKDDLLDRLDILGDARLDPMQVDLDELALFHALVGTGIADEHESFAVVNAQERDMSIMIVKDGELYAMRCIRIGTFAVTHGHAADEAAAEGLDHDIEVARTHEYLTRLSREIRRTLTTIPTLDELECVYITGSGSRLAGFDDTMGKLFGASVEPLDFLSHVDHQLDADEAHKYGPDIGVALGMAYKLNGLDLLRTEFRREEAAYTRKFDQVAAPLIVVAFLVLLATAFPALDAFLSVRKLNQEYERMTNLAANQLKTLAEDDAASIDPMLARAEFGPKRIQKALDQVRRYKQEVQGQLGRSDLIPELPSALTVWIELFETLKAHDKSIGRFQLQRLDINVLLKQPIIKMTGVLESTTKYQTLLDVLADRPMFQEVIPGSTKLTQDGSTVFTDLAIELDPERILFVPTLNP